MKRKASQSLKKTSANDNYFISEKCFLSKCPNNVLRKIVNHMDLESKVNFVKAFKGIRMPSSDEFSIKEAIYTLFDKLPLDSCWILLEVPIVKVKVPSDKEFEEIAIFPSKQFGPIYCKTADQKNFEMFWYNSRSLFYLKEKVSCEKVLYKFLKYYSLPSSKLYPSSIKKKLQIMLNSWIKDYQIEELCAKLCMFMVGNPINYETTLENMYYSQKDMKVKEEIFMILDNLPKFATPPTFSLVLPTLIHNSTQKQNPNQNCLLILPEDKSPTRNSFEFYFVPEMDCLKCLQMLDNFEKQINNYDSSSCPCCLKIMNTFSEQHKLLKLNKLLSYIYCRTFDDIEKTSLHHFYFSLKKII